MEKTLSIVIPSYNVSQYLPAILPTYFVPDIMNDLELLIVNDGSRDNTGEIADSFARQYPGTITVINKENGGHGSTINAGIKAASGKYFKVIDGDDWVESEALREFILKLKETDADVILNSFNRVTDETGEKVQRKIQGLTPGETYSFQEIIPVIMDSYAMHGTTFRTEIYRKAAPLDEHCFYVDQEYLLYPLPYVSSTVYYDIPVYQYRVGNEAQSMSLKNMQKNRAMHERVIMSLIEMLPHAGNEALEKLLLHRTGKMCQLQIDIFFSMEDRVAAKKELMAFLKKVKAKNNRLYIGIPGKKAKLLRLVGSMGYDAIKIVKQG